MAQRRYINPTTDPADGSPVGSVVCYSDIANPPTYFTILGIVRDAWGTQAELLSHTTGTVTTSPLRGAGWKRCEVALTPSA